MFFVKTIGKIFEKYAAEFLFISKNLFSSYTALEYYKY